MLRLFFLGDPNNPELTKFCRGFALGMLLFVFALLLLISFCEAAPPAHCQTPYRGNSVEHHDYHRDDYNVIVRQVVNDLYWSVGPEERKEALKEQIKNKVKSELADEAARPKTPAEKSALAGKKVLRLSCSTCHSPGTAAVNDDGAEPFYTKTGELKSLTGLERQAMYDAVKTGKMPPPPAPKLDNDDQLDLKAFFDSLK